jgi:tetratricopeptide (TPR) repeat protein
VERRFAVHARAYRKALIAALVAISAPAFAAPKGAAAKKQFDKGVKAYTAGDYAAASEAMGASYQLEKDPETLFAWAQSERKLENCDKAIELYNELLVYDLPAENKQVIETQIGECKDIQAAKGPKPDDTPKEAASPPAPVRAEQPPPAPSPAHEGGHWYGRPVADVVVLAGLGGLVYGGLKLASAASADSDKTNAMTYADFQRYSDKATKDGKLGVEFAAAGGALVVIGAIWYATHGDSPEKKKVTGWLGPSGGGLAVTGGF